MWTLNLEGLFRTPLKYAIYDEIPFTLMKAKFDICNWGENVSVQCDTGKCQTFNDL